MAAKITVAELLAQLELLPLSGRVLVVYDEGTAEGEVVGAEIDGGELRLIIK